MTSIEVQRSTSITGDSSDSHYHALGESPAKVTNQLSPRPSPTLTVSTTVATSKSTFSTLSLDSTTSLGDRFLPASQPLIEDQHNAMPPASDQHLLNNANNDNHITVGGGRLLPLEVESGSIRKSDVVRSKETTTTSTTVDALGQSTATTISASMSIGSGVANYVLDPSSMLGDEEDPSGFMDGEGYEVSKELTFVQALVEPARVICGLAVLLPAYVNFYEWAFLPVEEQVSSSVAVIPAGTTVTHVTEQQQVTSSSSAAEGIAAGAAAAPAPLPNPEQPLSIITPMIVCIGLPLTVLGLALFTVGLQEGLMPLGALIGRELTTNQPKLVPVVGFALGLLLTFGEPAIGALEEIASVAWSFPEIQELLGSYRFLTVTGIGAGVGMAASVGSWRLASPDIVRKWPMWKVVIAPTVLALICTFFCPVPAQGLAWDAGAVTTGRIFNRSDEHVPAKLSNRGQIGKSEISRSVLVAVTRQFEDGTGSPKFGTAYHVTPSKYVRIAPPRSLSHSTCPYLSRRRRDENGSLRPRDENDGEGTDPWNRHGHSCISSFRNLDGDGGTFLLLENARIPPVSNTPPILAVSNLPQIPRAWAFMRDPRQADLLEGHGNGGT